MRAFALLGTGNKTLLGVIGDVGGQEGIDNAHKPISAGHFDAVVPGFD